MSDQPTPSSPPPNRRRSSIVDMFTSRGNPTTTASSSPPSAAPTSTPAAGQHRRGMSIATLGLSGTSPGQTSPFDAFAKQRRASVATSSASGSPEFRNSFGDEAAVVEEDDNSKAPPNNSSSPFARRVSFGAQAMRDVKQGNGPGSPGAGEGFNWSEALRDRTKRSPSFSSKNPFSFGHTRSSSTTAVAPEPPKEMPKSPEPAPTSRMKKPDHLGERMLRGDFMMD